MKALQREDRARAVLAWQIGRRSGVKQEPWETLQRNLGVERATRAQTPQEIEAVFDSFVRTSPPAS